MPIAVSVKGKHHLQITEGLRGHAEQRLQKLNFFPDLREAVVIESVDKHGEHRVEVTLHGDNLTIRGEESTNNMYASLDRTVDKLEQRLRKLKAKRTNLRNHADTLRVNVRPNNGALNAEEGVLPASSDDETEAVAPQIVRTKAVTMKPMSTEDAMQMLDLVDHDWYIYLDMDTNQHQVLYRRRDGNFGLVVPKI